MPGMDQQRMKIHLRASLETLEIRRAIGVLEAWQYSEEAMMALTEPSLQLLVEFMESEAPRPGVYGTLKRAQVEFVKYYLKEEQRRNGKSPRGG